MNTLPDRLLIVDDEAPLCSFLEKVGAQLGFETKSLTDASRVVATLREYRPSVVIVDLKMPHHDGVTVLQEMRDARCTAQIIVISGLDQRVLHTAAKLGRSHGLRMLGALQKPIRGADLKALLQQGLGARREFTRSDLERAMQNNELVVHYQPKIVRNDEGLWIIGGAEALVRWQHPTQGLLLPESFVGVAEQSDLIATLTDYVLHTCIHQLAGWLARGLKLTLAVNMSARLIEDLRFPGRMRGVLREYAVPGSSLILELTESAAMADPAKAMDVFLRLRVSDISLAIDDFGTGFSSLKQLYQLPFDQLKIDRTFIHELPGDDEARAIVRATVDMAHALGMSVCAEGVETRAALEYLESVGCDQAQGFLISRPVPAVEFEHLVGPWSAQTLRRVASRP